MTVKNTIDYIDNINNHNKYEHNFIVFDDISVMIILV